jgi:hypothetical protein
MGFVALFSTTIDSSLLFIKLFPCKYFRLSSRESDKRVIVVLKNPLSTFGKEIL